VSTQQASQDNPLAGFGPNEWIVEEMYQRYLADPASVDPAWHDFFADYKPETPAQPAATEPTAATEPSSTPVFNKYTPKMR
jgi:2-oxoglutarate dehydrogenase E1 component